MIKKLKPSDYMIDGWDRSPHLAVHPFKKGSRHNKIGMLIMYGFYVTVSIKIIHLIYELNILDK
tara:strand:+ start:2472 stop:2663 length:192 start_codon:yes stop_codon:yes gene_type:complete